MLPRFRLLRSVVCDTRIMNDICRYSTSARLPSRRAFLAASAAFLLTFGRAPHATYARASVFYELPELMLNVGSPTNGAFLKVRLTLEFEKENDLIHVERMKHRIVDNLIWFLRNMRLEDFEGPGLERLKQQLHTRTDTIVAPAKVRAVLFKELILQ